MWKRENGIWCRVLMDSDTCHVSVKEQVLTEEETDLLEGKEHILGYYVVSGTLEINEKKLEKDTFLWFTGGTSCIAKIPGTAHVILIETERTPESRDLSMQVFEEEKLPWSRQLEDGITASRHMIRPEEYGVKIQTCIYTRGFAHQRHSHSTAHGFYVLEGMLAYQSGDAGHRILGPGEFAMSYAGEEMLHEPAQGSWCRYLFIGDGPFDFLVDGIDQYNR